jgi:tetratricopeptide (TPR) repeat protein
MSQMSFVNNRTLKTTAIFSVSAITIGIAITLLFFSNTAFLMSYDKHPTQGLTINYPLNGTIFPPELIAPTFKWTDTRPADNTWIVFIGFENNGSHWSFRLHTTQWRPDKFLWSEIKKKSIDHAANITIVGFRQGPSIQSICGERTAFTTSKDSVVNPLFYRDVILPFNEAVKDPSRLRWRFGVISDERQPPVVLEKLPVCGNCHSFSDSGKTLAMDVDYANDKGAYTITDISKQMKLTTSDIITWSDYKRDPSNPTFGLLSQISPNGRFVVSTVKDRSVFLAKPDLAFSQLFFPIQGILAVYFRDTRTFASLPGADDTALVQTNPSWSPNGKYIVFAQSPVYHLKNLRDKSKAILTPEECSEFLTDAKQFTYDLYRIPFNEGKGGKAKPLAGASNNGKSNFFARYSPNGKWIVYCQAKSFMLLQPDSKLNIMPAEGGKPRLMRCNTNCMNSWHSWSSNSRWLVFASKGNSPFTQLFLTHVDDQGNDAPAVVLDNLTAPDRAANIPEFVYTDPKAIERIAPQFIDDVSLWRAGMAFLNAHDAENAAIKFNEVLRLNPKNVRALVGLGNITEQSGKTDSAFVFYDRAVKADPSFEIAYVNKGNIFLRQELFEKAIEQYQTALRLSPRDLFANYNIAECYIKTKNYSVAIEHFMKGLRESPGDALSWVELGKVYLLSGNGALGIASLQKGVDLDPSIPENHQALANGLKKVGRGNEAMFQYKEALRLRPDFVEARDSLVALGNSSSMKNQKTFR